MSAFGRKQTFVKWKLLRNAIHQLMKIPKLNDRYWPYLFVKEGLNGAESDFRFVPESGRSEC